MSKYTTQVRYILETEYKKEYPETVEFDPNECVLYGTPSILSVDKAKNFSVDINYVVPDEVLRQMTKACNLVLLNNYTREIGLETVGLWKLKMQTRLNNIFPYYAEMFSTILNKFDPFIDTDITHTTNGVNNSNETEKGDLADKVVNETGNSEYNNSSETISNNKDKYSDTPQGSLQNVETGEYLTNARIVNNDVNDSDNGESNYSKNLTDKTKIDIAKQKDETINHTTTIKGKSGGISLSKMLIEYRKSIANVNIMFVDEFKDLFMLIY